MSHRLALVALAVALLEPAVGSAQNPAALADSLIRAHLRTAEAPYVTTQPPALRFGEGRYANVYIRGTGPRGIGAEVFGCMVTVAPQPGTPACVAVPRPGADSTTSPRILSPTELDAADLDGDGAPELTFELSYPGPLPEGFSGGEFDTYRRLYVIDASPEPHVAANVLIGVEAENWRVEAVRGTVAWRDLNGDRHDDIVFTGQTCAGTRGSDAHTRCRPLRRQYLWNAATQTWVERAAARR
ncbi:MAG: hypothetical protein AAB409_09950 [Gemmatimonadota bacterium]